MKRWEKFNESFGRSETLEEQAVKVYTHEVLDRVEHSPICGSLAEAAEALPLAEIYGRVKDWLQEEEETR